MPEKPTLVIVDVQKAFDDPVWGKRNNPGAEGNVARLLAAWRAADAPIIHVRHRETDPEWHFFNEGDPGFEFKPEAMPLADEPVVTKGVNSAFIGTDLEERLRAAGATTVVIAAIATDHCGSTTARMSGNLGFETWCRRRCVCDLRSGRAGRRGLPRRPDPPHESREPPRRIRRCRIDRRSDRKTGLGLVRYRPGGRVRRRPGRPRASADRSSRDRRGQVPRP